MIYDFGIYYRVFGHARHSGVVKKSFEYCIVGKIQRWLPFVQCQPMNQCHFLTA